MNRLIKLTLIADIFGCLGMGIFYGLKEKSLDVAFIGLIYSFGNIFIPLLIGVGLFQFLVRGTTNQIKMKVLLLQILSLLILFIMGLIAWATIDLIIDSKHLSIENIMGDFNSQFLGFTPALVIAAVAIPIIDKVLKKKDNNLNKSIASILDE
jgi:hypothetical protein